MIDVCMLLEGTYPFVSGGVSTWVHQLITAMKDIRFGILYIAPQSDPTRTPKYDIPNNVIFLDEIYLHNYDLDRSARRSPRTRDFEIVKNFYEKILKEEYDTFKQFVSLFRGPKKCFDAHTVFSSKKIWEQLVYFCEKISEDTSFLDYFWTWRGTHLPLMQILQSKIPEAKIYHAVSTGYAGLLGCIAKTEYESKFFLTEHGIYTHERVLEISQANWIYEKEKIHFRAERDLSFFKLWWITIFKVMSHLAYRHADRIFTLYEGNKIKQILEGAREDKIAIIPNGIDIKRYTALTREKKETVQIALIGRVVNIKDVKTFIRAAKIFKEQIPGAVFYIMGPTEEEEDYYDECRQLIDSLQMAEDIIFTGMVNINEYLKFLDLIVLTSLSEAQPYVILEANVVGIPVVATNVGACQEMLEGRTAEDQSLGKSGLIVPVSKPEETAAAMIKLIQDKATYNSFSKSGIQRVKAYYDQEDLLSRYLNIYEQNM
ncbi:MAG: GT4 family glycosyltransferase PelF [Deltaproteobacteria bacterium]|nr:GT4 family glycosyltransferase PelF [Deltaproteobacteria bacterium]